MMQIFHVECIIMCELGKNIDVYHNSYRNRLYITNIYCECTL